MKPSSQLCHPQEQTFSYLVISHSTGKKTQLLGYIKQLLNQWLGSSQSDEIKCSRNVMELINVTAKNNAHREWF